MKYKKLFKTLIKTAIVLFFPIIYLLIFGREYYFNENSREGMSYFTFCFAFPTCYLTDTISYYILNINDQDYFYVHLIAGTIQYSILPFFIYRLLKKINYDKNEFNLKNIK